MSEFDFWKYLHILMFVFWIGTDLAVFLSAKKSTDPDLSIETRFLLMHIALRIELLPRTVWKAALPLGVMLSVDMGHMDISGFGIAMVWVLSTIWWAISMTGAWYYQEPFGHKLGALTNWLTGLVGVFLIAVAIGSAFGTGPFDPEATWLLWKVGLYGLINVLIVAMLKVFDPLGVAFGQLAVDGSTPELEATISSVMSRSAVVIWATYATIALVAFIATTKLI
jgi:hypothetical protein